MLRKDFKKDFPIIHGTADPQEIERFNAWAEEWWNPNGAFKTVHDFNRARVRLISERLPILTSRDPKTEKPLMGLKIVDAGCGAGIVTEPISRLGGETIGIDAAERNVAVADRHARATGAPVKYRQALPEELTDQAGAFDVVMSLEVVEHVADRQAFLEALGRLVSPQGILLIGTINRSVRSYLTAILGAEYILRWLPRGTHDWHKFVTPAELDTDLGNFGFHNIECWGVTFNPLTMRWAIGKDISTNYLRFYRKS